MKLLITSLLSLLFFTTGLTQSQIGIGVNGGVSIPVGDFHEYYSVGYGGDVQLIYNVNNAFLLVLTSGYHPWKLDEDAYNKKANEKSLNKKFNLDSHFIMVPIYLGIRYYLARGKNRPFFSLDFGGYSYEFKIAGTINSTLPNTNSVPVNIPATKKSDTQTALAVGFGYFYSLSRNWNLEIHSKYNVLSSAYTISDPDKISSTPDVAEVYGHAAKMNFISIMAGVNYIF